MQSANGRHIVDQQLLTLLDVTCCVRLYTHPVACFLCVVRSCWAKFETVQTFSHVQTDATNPNIVGQECWKSLRPFAGSLGLIKAQGHPTTKRFKIRQKCLKWCSLCSRSLFG